MDEFNALASSLAEGLREVRGCLILSRDGLVLGSSPADAEASVTPAWVRFAALGDTERGFAQFGPETWCYVRRGPYGAFAIAGPRARPGLVLDQMDQALFAAEEARARHDAAGTRAGEISAPSSRPRTNLHSEPLNGKEPVVIDVPRNEAAFADPPKDLPAEPKDDLGFGAFPTPWRAEAEVRSTPDTETLPDTPMDLDTQLVPEAEAMHDAPPEPETPIELETQLVPDTPAELETDDWAEPPAEAAPEAVAEPVAPAWPEENDPESPARDDQAEPGSPAWDADADPWEAGGDEQHDVDRFSLAQEFGQLLQRGEDPADG